MDIVTDIKRPIALYMDDVETLVAFCNTNKDSRKMCSTYDFWKSQFEQYDLPLNERPTTTEEWIDLYKTTFDIVNKVNLILSKYTVVKTTKNFHLIDFVPYFDQIDKTNELTRSVNFLGILKDKSTVYVFFKPWVDEASLISIKTSISEAKHILYDLIKDNMITNNMITK